MAVGLPAKTTYADGDVFSASDINDTNGTLNLVGQTNNFYAGKNKIINGDFTINQRAFTSTTTSGTYTFDRWRLVASGGTSTLSAETFTPGAAPVAGYESKNFARLVSTGQSGTNDNTRLGQRIEDVRTFAGQTITISFWAKASTGTPSVAAYTEQEFGSGGSAAVANNGNKVVISSSWARYSVSLAVASISGKTIGTGSFLGTFLVTSAGSNFNSQTNSLGIQSETIDIWGVQVEAGSVATAFQTATGTIQGELAACQRYYQRHSFATASVDLTGLGVCISSTEGYVPFTLFTTLRVAPTSVDYANVRISDITTIAVDDAVVVLTSATPDFVTLLATKAAAGFTTHRPCVLRVDPSGNGFIGISAEL